MNLKWAILLSMIPAFAYTFYSGRSTKMCLKRPNLEFFDLFDFPQNLSTRFQKIFLSMMKAFCVFSDRKYTRESRNSAKFRSMVKSRFLLTLFSQKQKFQDNNNLSCCYISKQGHRVPMCIIDGTVLSYLPKCFSKGDFPSFFSFCLRAETSS